MNLKDKDVDLFIAKEIQNLAVIKKNMNNVEKEIDRLHSVATKYLKRREVCTARLDRFISFEYNIGE